MLNDLEIQGRILQAFKDSRGRRRGVDGAAVYALSLCALLVIFSLFNILSHLHN